MRRDANARERTVQGVLRQVRRRWQLKVLLRGGSIVVAAALALWLFSSWLLERNGFTPWAVIAVRIATYLPILWLAWRYLVRPLALRVSDERVALYLEEHEPALNNLLVSAVDVEQAGQQQPLARRTLELALARCQALEDGRALDRASLRRFGGSFGILAATALFLALVQPALLRQGADVLLNPLRGALASSPYSIEVSPGNVTIARGADQTVTATLHGFNATDAQLVVRSGSDSSFQRLPMFAGADSGSYEVLLFDVAQPTEYFVEAGGNRSAVFRIDVADVPYVKSMAVEYHYPAYTGRAVERVADGGDVAAISGTVVQLYITTTVPATGGEIVLSTGGRLPLRADSAGVLTGAFRILQPGFYQIMLRTSAGTLVSGSPQYMIDVLADRAPVVRFSKPGRDTRPTNVDEVFLEAQAEDDYGVRSVELRYSVNGGEEQSRELFRSEQGLSEVTAGHTLYLEELGLQPGDVVSYYALARDGSAAGKPVSSDIYFLTIRPFGRDYRQAESGGQQGGGGGQQGENPGELTQQQREIIAATFNLSRDSAQYTADAYREYLNTIVLMQDRLRQQVLTLAQRMRNRQVTSDSMFARIAATLPRAGAVMDTALAQLRTRGARPALPPEQRALQQLERAEALYREVQVQMQQQGGGGGGGGGSSARDLADLFELELDKLRNQYETVQRGERQQTEQQTDEALEKLRELARRLQQETERMRRQAMQSQSSSQQSGGAGGASQRQLADEIEQAARQLQRLSREQPQNAEAERAARELQQAADALRRGAADARTGNSASAQQALDRVQQAQRRLENERGSGVEREAREALRRAQQLAQQQQETGRAMASAAAQGQQNSAQTQELINRRTQQLNATQQLEQQIDRLAAGTRQEQRDASRKLQEAADRIRESNLKEMQSFSRNLMRDRASADMVRQFEDRIEQAMDSVVAQLGTAVGAFTRSDAQRVAEGLERARELARGLESMRERTSSLTAPGNREAGERPGEPGRAGQQQQRQGQQQGQGQQGERGQQQGGQGPGDPRTGGRVSGGAAGGRVQPGLTGEQARQLRGEAGERREEAEALRRELRAQGRDVSALDDVIGNLRRLEGTGAYADPDRLSKLQTDAVEAMKAYEFALRRALLGESREKLFLAGSEDVPPGFRKAVEEYYRLLSRGR